MPRLRLYVKIALALAFSTVLMAVLGLVLFFKPAAVKRQLTHSLEAFSLEAQFDSLELSFFPSMTARIKQFEIASRNHPGNFIKGKNGRIFMDPFRILFGKVKVVGFETENSEVGIRPFEDTENGLIFSQAFLRLKPKGSDQAHLDFISAFEDVPHAVALHADFSYNLFASAKWKEAAMKGEIEFKNLIMSTLNRRLYSKWPLKFTEGKVNGTFKAEKKSKETDFVLTGKLEIEEAMYQIQDGLNKLKSPSFNAGVDLHGIWNMETRELNFEQVVIRSPLGKTDIAGLYRQSNQEFSNLRISASQLVIENIPLYVLFFKNVIPVNIGFSGPSDLEMSLEGTWDHLALHGNWNFTPTLLSYSRFFSKPKDFPMDSDFDLLLKNGKILTGDISARLQDANFKGTLKDLNCETAQGEFNFITNKFKLAGWETLLPPLKPFSLDGEIKIFMNVRGSILSQADRMFNLSIEDGAITQKGGVQIRNIDLALDYGPVALEVKKLSLKINDSPLEGKLLFHNVKENITLKGDLNSKTIYPSQLLTLGALVQALNLSFPDPLKQIDIALPIQAIFPPSEPVHDLQAQFNYENQHFSLKPIELKSYGGTSRFEAEFDLKSIPVRYQIKGDIQKLNLARYFSRSERPINGNLFSTFQVSAAADAKSWLKNQATEGAFSITNGEFNTFDLVGAIGQIEGFEEIGLLSNQKTVFNDLKGNFSWQDEKIQFKNLTLVSSDLFAEAEGEAFPDGRLNFRINTYLSPTLTEHFLTPLWGKGENFRDKQFGPIPLLLSGPLSKPELKPDSIEVLRLKEDLDKKKTQRILRNFLPEETLFETDSKS